jgi:hypothetical protein
MLELLGEGSGVITRRLRVLRGIGFGFVHYGQG